MTSVVKSALPAEARRVTCEALQDTLVDLLGLSLIAKQTHWNIVGPRFRSIHRQLDEVVAAARSYADAAAERAAALDTPPDGRPSTVASGFTLPGPPEGWLPDSDVVQVMVDALEAAVGRLRERIDATEKSDLVTQDLLIGMAAEFEKQQWMFAAQNVPAEP